MKRTVVTYVTVVALSVLTTLPAVCTPAHEETPRGFVLSLLRSYPHHGLKVGKIAAVESYAIVPFSGAWMEGKEWNSELLLKKYPFGWQALDYNLQSCKLRKRGIDARTTGALLRFVRHPSRSDPRECDGTFSDEGAISEVTAIRAQLATKVSFATLYRLVRVTDGSHLRIGPCLAAVKSFFRKRPDVGVSLWAVEAPSVSMSWSKKASHKTLHANSCAGLDPIKLTPL